MISFTIARQYLGSVTGAFANIGVLARKNTGECGLIFLGDRADLPCLSGVDPAEVATNWTDVMLGSLKHNPPRRIDHATRAQVPAHPKDSDFLDALVAHYASDLLRFTPIESVEQTDLRATLSELYCRFVKAQEGNPYASQPQVHVLEPMLALAT